MFKQVNLDLLTIKNKFMEFTYFIGTDVSKVKIAFGLEILLLSLSFIAGVIIRPLKT